MSNFKCKKAFVRNLKWSIVLHFETSMDCVCSLLFVVVVSLSLSTKLLCIHQSVKSANSASNGPNCIVLNHYGGQWCQMFKLLKFKFWSLVTSSLCSFFSSFSSLTSPSLFTGYLAAFAVVIYCVTTSWSTFNWKIFCNSKKLLFFCFFLFFQLTSQFHQEPLESKFTKELVTMNFMWQVTSELLPNGIFFLFDNFLIHHHQWP